MQQGFLLFILLFGIVVSAQGDPSVANLKSSAKEQSAIQDIPYRCEVEIGSHFGNSKKTFILKKETQFVGTEPHQLVTLFAKDGKRGMSINVFYKNASDPYYIDSISCSNTTNCSASRIKYRKGMQTKAPLDLQTSVSGEIAVLGKQTIFKYSQSSNDFIFENPQLEVSNTESIRVRAVCHTL